MIICKALLKDGYSNFSFSILEYCEPNKCLDREQYYIDLLKPSYNIFIVAGSSLGFKHSLDTKEKLRIHGSSSKMLKHLKILNLRLKNDSD